MGTINKTRLQKTAPPLVPISNQNGKLLLGFSDSFSVLKWSNVEEEENEEWYCEMGSGDNVLPEVVGRETVMLVDWGMTQA
jgi:hypothetical protein